MQQRAEKAAAAGRSIESGDWFRVYRQLWGLLPAFSIQPLDLGEIRIHQKETQKSDVTKQQRQIYLLPRLLELIQDSLLRESVCAAIVALAKSASPPGVHTPQLQQQQEQQQQQQQHVEGFETRGTTKGTATPAGLKMLSFLRRLADAVAAAGAAAGDTAAATAAAAARIRGESAAAARAARLCCPTDSSLIAAAVTAAATAASNKETLAAYAEETLGFLTVRYLLLHKETAAATTTATAAAAATGTAAAEDAFAALSPSAKAKAAQQVLQAIQVRAETETERQGDRDTGGDREAHRRRQRQKERQRERGREERDSEGERETDRGRDRERQRERDRANDSDAYEESPCARMLVLPPCLFLSLSPSVSYPPSLWLEA